MSVPTTISVLFATALLVAGSALAQEPSLHEVYQAAQSGNLTGAQRMMQEVLRAHPNSAKAHYVEAELLAKQGQLSAASAELSTAERLDPRLSFAKPEAVRELKARVATSPHGFGSSVMPTPASGGGAGIPWGLLLGGAAVIGLIVLAFRSIRRSAASASPTAVQPYGSNPPQPTASPMSAPGSSGIGSGILGGLATGAALGAGMVAGEALAHRLGGHHDAAGTSPQVSDTGQPSDLGGNDFGVADNSSWDDGFGGVDGGSDWT